MTNALMKIPNFLLFVLKAQLDVYHSTLAIFQMMIRTKHLKTPHLQNHEKCFDIFKNKGLHMIHINARTLLPNISDIRLLATRTTIRGFTVAKTEHREYVLL